jgi:hypothetical protein
VLLPLWSVLYIAVHTRVFQCSSVKQNEVEDGDPIHFD